MLSGDITVRFVRRFLVVALLASHQPIWATSKSAESSAHLAASPERGWPQFRGPRRDGVSDERGLLSSWPEGGPKRLWSVSELGKGYSSPVIADGRLFITGDVEGELRIFAFDLQGKALWTAKNGTAWLSEHPGTRATVTYSRGRIYHQNAHGRVACLDAANGREIWAADAKERFGGRNITWGLSECLVVDERAVYVTVGGSTALVVALDKTNGETLWKSEALAESQSEQAAEGASYAAPILVQFAGRRLLIGCSGKHLYCVDADAGRLQWTQPLPTAYSVLAMSPVLMGDGVFMTAPLGKDFGLFKLIAPGNSAEKVGVAAGWSTPLDTCQGGVVFAGGKLIGSYYSPRKGWAALDPHTGALLYSAPEFTKGSVLHADGRLYALCEDGWMVLLEAGDRQFETRGKFRLVEPVRRDVWAHPAIADGRLYLRYHDALHCYEIRDDSAPAR